MQHYTLTVVFNRDKTKVLVQNHKNRGWNYPGGHVEDGESILDASYRELQEETGIMKNQIDLQELNYIQTVYDHNDICIHITYGVLKDKPKLMPEEDDVLMWVLFDGKFWMYSGRDYDGLAWVILQWARRKV